MKPVINADNLRYFAYCNGNACVRPVRGIAVEFKGLGNQEMIDGETERGLRFADQGLLYYVPYLNPWAWMNPQAVRQTDEILAVAEGTLGQMLSLSDRAGTERFAVSIALPDGVYAAEVVTDSRKPIKFVLN